MGTTSGSARGAGASDGTTGFAHVPALDGLRGVAVLAVLGFHARLGLPGGFLGVSLFFTLSGYLITSLLLAERAGSGRIDLGAFWARRARRLLPAAVACVALVVAAGPWWTSAQRDHLGGDVLASLGYVANWWFIAGETTYQDLFIGAPSPLAHMWSLAVEEQVYLVLPLVVAVALLRGRRWLVGVAAALAAASVAATLATADGDLVYQGTHTRAAEVLVGVVLAVVLPRFGETARRRALPAAGVVAAAVFAAAMALVPADARWWDVGGLAAFALVSACLIAATTEPGPVTAVLSWSPLRRVGLVSYGLYLYHWPVFVLLDVQQPSWPAAVRVGVGLAVTGVITVASYRWLEQPIRRRRTLVVPRRALLAATVSVVGVAAAALVVVPAPTYTETERLLAVADDGRVDFGVTLPDPAPSDAPTASPTSPVPDRPATLPVATRRPVVLVVGSAADLADHLSRSTAADGADPLVVDATNPTCTVAPAAEVRRADGTIVPLAGCVDPVSHWASLVGEHRPEVVVVTFGPLDRALPRFALDVGYPDADDLPGIAARWDAVETAVAGAVDSVVALGVPVVLADRSGAAHDGQHVLQEILDRTDLQHPTIDGVVTELDATAVVVDRLVDGRSTMRPGDTALRVLVTGDSVSLDLARALSDGSSGSLDVTWAGESGCPFARVEAFRFSSDGPWKDNACEPFDERLPPLLDEIRPDVVILSTTVVELAEHRIPGVPGAHAAGDPEFDRFHDAEIDELVDLLDDHDVPLLIADAYPPRAGGYATREMADPDRVAAWNDWIARTAARYPGVAVFPFAGPLGLSVDRFGAAAIMPDGVHPAVEALTEIARWVYVPLVHDQTAQLVSAQDGHPNPD